MTSMADKYSKTKISTYVPEIYNVDCCLFVIY